MGNRRQNRIFVSLPVSVSGVDGNGNPFMQTARTIDVSPTGARLDGIGCLSGPGAAVTIKHAGHSARFRIVWVGLPGSSEDGQFGVKALQREKQLWRVQFGEPRQDPYVNPQKVKMQHEMTEQAAPVGVIKPKERDHKERRGAKRVKCSGTAQVSQAGVAFPIWAKVADLSLGGCYLELVFTIPRGTSVTLRLTVLNQTFAAKGVVVTFHPGVGNGFRFLEIAPDEKEVLCKLMDEITRVSCHRLI
jgi:PilZ domain-containing protein